jgi:hypothetical protein
MSHRHRRYSKRELLGSLHVDYVMSVTDLGLAAGSNRWDVLRAFLAVGEARAESRRAGPPFARGRAARRDLWSREDARRGGALRLGSPDVHRCIPAETADHLCARLVSQVA